MLTRFKHNWNNVGLRLTESGSISIKQVQIPGLMLSVGRQYEGS